MEIKRKQRYCYCVRHWSGSTSEESVDICHWGIGSLELPKRGPAVGNQFLVSGAALVEKEAELIATGEEMPWSSASVACFCSVCWELFSFHAIEAYSEIS